MVGFIARRSALFGGLTAPIVLQLAQAQSRPGSPLLKAGNGPGKIVGVAQPNNRPEVATYLAALGQWPAPEPKTITPGVAATPSRPVRSDGSHVTCTTTHYTLAANPDKIVMFEPDIATLWPGALLQGKGLLKLGSLKELPIKKRSPLPVSVDLLTVPNSKIVLNPSSTSVGSAIAELMAPIDGRNLDFGSSMSFSMTETYSAEQAMLALGVSARYAGGDFTAKHSATTSDDKRVITACLIQKCFTVHIENPLTPSDLFSPDLTLADLTEQEKLGRIGTDNIPVLLSSVSYGRMLYVTISSTRSFSDIMTAMNASYSASGQGGSADFKDIHRKTLNEAALQISGIGIEDTNAAAIIRTGRVQEFFSTPMRIRSLRPISYIFYNLRDLSIAGLADTAEYDITICQPEVVGADVTTHIDAVNYNLKNYPEFVIAAADNDHDPGTRGLRIPQYRNYSGEVVANLMWIQKNFVARSGDEKEVIKRWIPSVIEEIEKQERYFQIHYNSEPSKRPFYAEGIRLSNGQKSVAIAIRGAA